MRYASVSSEALAGRLIWRVKAPLDGRFVLIGRLPSRIASGTFAVLIRRRGKIVAEGRKIAIGKSV